MTLCAAGASVHSVVFILSDEIFPCPPLLSQYEAGAGPAPGGVAPHLVIKHLDNELYCLFINLYCLSFFLSGGLKDVNISKYRDLTMTCQCLSVS